MEQTLTQPTMTGEQPYLWYQVQSMRTFERYLYVYLQRLLQSKFLNDKNFFYVRIC